MAAREASSSWLCSCTAGTPNHQSKAQQRPHPSSAPASHQPLHELRWAIICKNCMGMPKGKKKIFFEKKCGESTFLLVLHPERSWGEPGAAGGCSLGGSACCGLFPAYFTAASARFCLPLGLREAPEAAKQLPPPRSCDFSIPAKRRPQISLPAPSGAGSFLHPTPRSQPGWSPLALGRQEQSCGLLFCRKINKNLKKTMKINLPGANKHPSHGRAITPALTCN